MELQESLRCFVSLVGEALQTLSDDDRLLLTLLYVDGLQQNQVAAILGVHPGQISRRRKTALKRFHEAIEALGKRRFDDDGFQGIFADTRYRSEIVRRGRNESVGRSAGGSAMNMPDRNETLRHIFTAAANMPGKADSTEHPIDDDALLIDWSVGDLSPERHAEFVRHLANCDYCRRELAAMIRAGALTPPSAAETEVDVEDEDESDVLPPVPDRQPAPVRPAEREGRSVRGNRSLLIAFAAVAASALFVLLWVQAPTTHPSVAMSRRDLQEGRPEAAFDRIGRLLDEEGDLDAETAEEARGLLEESGYRVAKSRLEDSRFEKVGDIASLTRERGVKSGRLANLRMQALRGTVEKDAQVERLALEHLTVKDGGESHLKGSLDFPGPAERRIDDEFEREVADYPDSLELHLNYGQFLMETMREFKRAAEQFEKAAALAPDDPRPYTGWGLVLLQQKEGSIAEALGHFEKAAELAPDDEAVRKNLEMVRKRLQKEQ